MLRAATYWWIYLQVLLNCWPVDEIKGNAIVFATNSKEEWMPITSTSWEVEAFTKINLMVALEEIERWRIHHLGMFVHNPSPDFEIIPNGPAAGAIIEFRNNMSH